MCASGSTATQPIELKRGHEYAASIINAYLGGELFKFNGNVPNAGLGGQSARGGLCRGAGAGQSPAAGADSGGDGCPIHAPS